MQRKIFMMQRRRRTILQPTSVKILRLPKELSGLINVREEETPQEDLTPLKEIANKKVLPC